jgi:hypothetical protein
MNKKGGNNTALMKHICKNQSIITLFTNENDFSDGE